MNVTVLLSKIDIEVWQEWLELKRYIMGKGNSLLDKGYEGVFENLSEADQVALIGRKICFGLKIHFKANMGVM